MDMLVASLTPGTAEALRAGHAWYAAFAAIEHVPTVDEDRMEVDERKARARRRIDALDARATAADNALPDGTTRSAVIATIVRSAEVMAEITGRIG